MIRNDKASTIQLNGTWDFSLGSGPLPGGDPLCGETGAREGKPEGTIHVPGCWEAQGYPKGMEGPARYRTQFRVPRRWAGRTFLLEFDAVSYHYTRTSVNMSRWRA